MIILGEQLEKDQKLLKEIESGLSYKGLEQGRLKKRSIRSNASSKSQERGSTKKPTNIHNPLPIVKKDDLNKPALNEEDYVLPKMNAFSMKKQMLIRNLIKETK